MKLNDFIAVCDRFVPVWLNIEHCCERFETVEDIPGEYHTREIEYITCDCDMIITLELKAVEE